MSKTRLINFMVIALLGVALLAGCVAAAPSTPPDSQLSLTAPKTSKPLAKAIESFKVTLTNDAEAEAEIDISLDTVRGADWRAALCYEAFCFMHDGRTTTHHTLPLTTGEARAFEIKFFVPESAQSGEAKTVKMATTVVGSRAAGPSVELEGIVS